MKDYSKEVFPLNHFVLWCKGWYYWKDQHSPFKSKEQLLKEIKWCLNKDGYLVEKSSLNSCLSLISLKFQEYARWHRENREKLDLPETYCEGQLFDFIKEFERQKSIRLMLMSDKDGSDKEMSDDEAFIYTIATFFKFTGKNEIVLTPPIYEKHGPVIHHDIYKHGMTRKEMDKLAHNYFAY